jgi:hypothetical protein
MMREDFFNLINFKNINYIKEAAVLNNCIAEIKPSNQT